MKNSVLVFLILVLNFTVYAQSESSKKSLWSGCSKYFSSEDLYRDPRGEPVGSLSTHQNLILTYPIGSKYQHSSNKENSGEQDKAYSYDNLGELILGLVRSFEKSTRDSSRGPRIVVMPVDPSSAYGVNVRFEDFPHDEIYNYTFDYVESDKTFYDVERADGTLGFSRSSVGCFANANLSDLGLFYCSENIRSHWAKNLPVVRRETISTRLDADKKLGVLPARDWLFTRQSWTRKIERREVSRGLGLFDYLGQVNNGLHHFSDYRGKDQSVSARHVYWDLSEMFLKERFLHYLQDELGAQRRVKPWARLLTERLGARLVYIDADGRHSQIGFVSLDQYSLSEYRGEGSKPRAPYRSHEIDIEIVPEFLPPDLDLTLEGSVLDVFYSELVQLLPKEEEITASHFPSKIFRLSRY